MPEVIRINATDFGRELLYPVKQRAIVYAVLFYWLLFWLAQSAGRFGLWLLIITVPASVRYMLLLLEARANGWRAPIPTVEMFAPWDNLWALTPLIHIGIAVWAGIWIAGLGSRVATTFSALALLLVLPASLAVLAVTHSPAASLNPLAMMRMIRACGPAYFNVPVTLGLLSTISAALLAAGAPLILVDLVTIYAVVLLFTLTGAVTHARNIAAQIDIGDALEATAGDLAEELEDERKKVANHAYGFISRGNRAAGFAHIREWLDAEVAPDEAWRWFFLEMLKWENNDAALFFAQEYLRQLLEWGLYDEALKVVFRSLHENPQWRPLPQDREAVIELAQTRGRKDLLDKLQG